ncbi:MAG: hypothetical protein AAGJ08_25475 [Cyanobacteria bacterium P01_H01_bin.35]
MSLVQQLKSNCLPGCSVSDRHLSRQLFTLGYFLLLESLLSCVGIPVWEADEKGTNTTCTLGKT